MASALFDECLKIADDDHNDVVEDAEGKVQVNNAAIQRARLRIETRMRMAGKYNAALAEKPDREANQVTVNNNTLHIDARSLAPDQRDKLRAMLIEARDASKLP